MSNSNGIVSRITRSLQTLVGIIVASGIRLTLRFVLFPIVRLIWIKRVTGIEHIPEKGGALIVCNHQSFFDFIGFMAITPRPIYYIAAEKFYNKELNPLWKPVLEATGQIRVDRQAKDKTKMYDEVYAHLAQGDLIGIFPEGTRSASPTEMSHAFTGAVRFAIAARVPIVPVGIKGAYEIMSRHDKRPRLKKILTFTIDRPVTFETYYDEEVTKEKLQELTDTLMQHIGTLSGKIYPYAPDGSRTF